MSSALATGMPKKGASHCAALLLGLAHETMGSSRPSYGWARVMRRRARPGFSPSC